MNGNISGLTVERSPEKAGVGGSSPSLATMFSVVYRLPLPRICSILFQIPYHGLPGFASFSVGPCGGEELKLKTPQAGAGGRAASVFSGADYLWPANSPYPRLTCASMVLKWKMGKEVKECSALPAGLRFLMTRCSVFSAAGPCLSRRMRPHSEHPKWNLYRVRRWKLRILQGSGRDGVVFDSWSYLRARW